MTRSLFTKIRQLHTSMTLLSSFYNNGLKVTVSGGQKSIVTVTLLYGRLVIFSIISPGSLKVSFPKPRSKPKLWDGWWRNNVFESFY